MKGFLLVFIFVLLLLLELLSPMSLSPKNSKRVVYNIVLGLFNTLIIITVIKGVNTFIFDMIEGRNLGLLGYIREYRITKIIISFLFMDFFTYWWHRANHQLNFLYKFHMVHHTDPFLDTSTALRFHIIEYLLSTIFRVIYYLILGIGAYELIVYETVLNISSYFHHSNIYIDEKIDKKLRYIIVSPNMHKVHHFKSYKEQNSNFSSIFSIWDRIFGSYREYKYLKDFGMIKYKDEKYQSLVGMLKTPFIKDKK